MSTKHTPGPWVIRAELYENPRDWMIESSSGRWIACFPHLVDIAAPQQKADARLIAAAPELLDGLKELLYAYRFVMNLSHGQEDGYSANAHNVIAKATGESE